MKYVGSVSHFDVVSHLAGGMSDAGEIRLSRPDWPNSGTMMFRKSQGHDLAVNLRNMAGQNAATFNLEVLDRDNNVLLEKTTISGVVFITMREYMDFRIRANSWRFTDREEAYFR